MLCDDVSDLSELPTFEQTLTKPNGHILLCNGLDQSDHTSTCRLCCGIDRGSGVSSKPSVFRALCSSASRFPVAAAPPLPPNSPMGHVNACHAKLFTCCRTIVLPMSDCISNILLMFCLAFVHSFVSYSTQKTQSIVGKVLATSEGAKDTSST